MSAYRGSVASLVTLADRDILADRVAEQLRMTGTGVSAAEHRSWSRSLTALTHDLMDAGLGQVEMLIEYKLPLTSKRADVVLAGQHPQTGADSFLVVELKQWSAAQTFDDAENLVTVDHVAAPRLHPAVQVAAYCSYLGDFLGIAASATDMIRGVAYLHNATDHDVSDLLKLPATEQSRMFTGQRRGDFIEYLKTRFAPLSGAAAGDRFMTSAVRPSQQLLTHAADILKQRTHFTLIDDQRIAYERVLSAVHMARREDSKRVIVVSGGPGSGKSVIALTLLSDLARLGYPVLHATGSKSFTETLRKYAGRGSNRTKELFRYFNKFMDADKNGIDVLICDEAHRIRKTSVDRFTPKAARETSRGQIEELIAAARVPVFLLDEHQVVRPGEMGSMDVITSRAHDLGLEVEVLSLHDQFRCGGSDAYERWVLALLGLADAGPVTWVGDGNIDVRMAPSPAAMEEFLRAREGDGDSARMAAGFCWPWSDPRQDGSLVDDVQIDGWSRPWNAKSERSVGGAPGRSYWATDPAGFGQVGCVYTAQGFEYDWSGVIIGPDLVIRDGKVMTRRAESRDPELMKKKAVSDELADQLIRNTYKVLLTRGMRGTVIYATDAETQEFLTDLVQQRQPLETNYAPRAEPVAVNA